jgi:hypothetical protein
LTLRNGKKLKDYDFSLSIIPGEFSSPHPDLKFATDAFGGLFYLDDQDYVHGYFYFDQNTYDAVWDQVRRGGYANCKFHVGFEPEDYDRWKDNPLSITSAEVKFDRSSLPAVEVAKPNVWQAMAVRLGNVLFWVGVIIAAGWLSLWYPLTDAKQVFGTALVAIVIVGIGWALRYILGGRSSTS